MHAHVLSRVWLFATPWTIACQDPLSVGFSRQEYWSGLPFPTLGDLPDPGIKPAFLTSPALAGRFFTTGKPTHLSTEFHFQKLVLEQMNLGLQHMWEMFWKGSRNGSPPWENMCEVELEEWGSCVAGGLQQGLCAGSRRPWSTVPLDRSRCLHPQAGLQWWAVSCPFLPHQTEPLFSSSSFF